MLSEDGSPARPLVIGRRGPDQQQYGEARRLCAPSEALPAAQATAGVGVGTNSPRPILKHAFSRQRARDAFATILGFAHAG